MRETYFLGTATEILVCLFVRGTGIVCDKRNKSSESDLMVLFSCIDGTAKVSDSYYVI
jgi:hypothetical protein